MFSTKFTKICCNFAKCKFFEKSRLERADELADML